RTAAAGRDRTRRAGAVRETADAGRAVVAARPRSRGEARPTPDPGGVHAPLRRGVRRAQAAAGLRRTGPRAAAALRAPQPVLPARLHQPDDGLRLGGARVR